MGYFCKLEAFLPVCNLPFQLRIFVTVKQVVTADCKVILLQILQNDPSEPLYKIDNPKKWETAA